MQITLYPNNELRARVTTPPFSKRAVFDRRKLAEAPILSIVENLRLIDEDIFRREKNSPEERPGYGGSPKLRDFSLYGRRKIVRSGALIGVGDRRDRTLFLTGTLPGGTDEALRAISDYSAWIVHQLLTVVPRLGRVKSADCKIIWVWEWQDRGALHLHAICEFPTREAAKRVFEGFKGLWIQLLESVGDRCGIDIAARRDFGSHSGDYDKWRTRAEWSRKNPSRYLAKYISRLKPKAAICLNYPPSRWYGVSRSLHSELREKTVVALTSDVTGVPDYRLGGDYDIELIERLFSLSHTTRHFPDKVRDGYTFVFYLNDVDRTFVENLMKSMRGKQEMDPLSLNKLARRKRYPYLDVILIHPRANANFLADIGDFSRELLEIWYEGDEIPDYELEFLNSFAATCLINAGCIDQVTPPERSGAGLTGLKADKIETDTPPLPSFDQPSLFP